MPVKTRATARKALVAVASLALLGAGCASDETTPVSSTADGVAATEGASSEPTEPVAVEFVLNWTTSLSEWSGIIAALELGLYEDAGLNVSVQRVAGSVEAVSTVGAGQGDLAFGAAESVLGGIAEGMPLRAVAAVLQTNPIGLIAPAESGIRSVGDLDGKKVSTAHAGPEPAILQALLPEGANVELVYVDPQAKCTLTLSGNTDACTGTAAFQPIQLRDAGLDAQMIPFSTDENPIVGPVIFGHGDFLEAEPAAVEAFLAATYEGFMAASQDVEQTLDWYEEYFEEFDREFMRKGLEITQDYLYSPVSSENGWGWMVRDQWSGLHDSLLDAEAISAPVEIDEAFTTKYLTGPRDWEQG